MTRKPARSWHDYLMEQALDYMVFDTAMTARASEEGYTLSEDAQSSLESSRTDLETVWVGSYNSRDAYIRANYGPYMTYDHLMELLEMRTLASDYASSYYDGLTYDDADYERLFTGKRRRSGHLYAHHPHYAGQGGYCR